MPLRLEKNTDVDIAAKKREYGPSELKWQADKACSSMKVNLGLVFTCVGARKGLKRDAELARFQSKRLMP